jgi:hypothetical protein
MDVTATSGKRIVALVIVHPGVSGQIPIDRGGALRALPMAEATVPVCRHMRNLERGYPSRDPALKGSGHFARDTSADALFAPVHGSLPPASGQHSRRLCHDRVRDQQPYGLHSNIFVSPR